MSSLVGCRLTQTTLFRLPSDLIPAVKGALNKNARRPSSLGSAMVHGTFSRPGTVAQVGGEANWSGLHRSSVTGVGEFGWSAGIDLPGAALPIRNLRLPSGAGVPKI